MINHKNFLIQLVSISIIDFSIRLEEILFESESYITNRGGGCILKKYDYVSIFLFTTLIGLSNYAGASGFALIEQSGSGLGNAFAGSAASAEDASTIFYNPAGMAFLPDNQVVLGMHVINPDINFSSTGSRSGLGFPESGDNGGNTGSLTFLPNFYFAKSITDTIHLGIGVNTPFGLKTEYNDQWVGRYQTVKSEVNSININPSIAYKANDKLSLGFGVSAMRIDADLTSAVDFGTILGSLTSNPLLFQKLDGTTRTKGDDWGFGWNAGVIFQPTDDTRIGLSYRSQIHETLKGTTSFYNVPAPLAASFQNGPVTAKLVTPDSASISIFTKLDEKWDLLGDLSWTDWSKFQNLTIIRTSGTIVSSNSENWHNTLRVSAGANYHVDENLKLKVGVAYDESPVSDLYRTARIPDNDRIWLSFGGQYKLSETSKIDVGYTHIFVKDASLDKTNEIQTASPALTAALQDKLIGNYSSSIDMMSVQFSHSF